MSDIIPHKKSPPKTPWEQASDWFARTLAIVMVMIAPGAAGGWLDKQFGTSFITAIGFALGMVLAISLLMIFARIKPIDNDGEIMSRRVGNSNPTLTSSKSATQKPSESSLPDVPGAEVLEPSRDE